MVCRLFCIQGYIVWLLSGVWLACGGVAFSNARQPLLFASRWLLVGFACTSPDDGFGLKFGRITALRAVGILFFVVCD